MSSDWQVVAYYELKYIFLTAPVQQLVKLNLLSCADSKDLLF